MSSSTLSNLTFRNAVFQVHWLLGITAGVVLALVGFTGGMLSFEDELLKAGAYRVYRDAAELHRSLDELGISA